MNLAPTRLMTFGSAYPQKAVQSPKPAASPVQFGIIELGRDEYDKAQNLYDAGVALARAGETKAAMKNLLKACEDDRSVQLDVIKTLIEGIEPGLPPNPAKAAELLDNFLEPAKHTSQTWTEHGTETVTRYQFGFGGYEPVARIAAKLASFDPKYQQVAINVLLSSGGNENGTASTAKALAEIGASNEGRSLLVKYFDQLGQERKLYPTNNAYVDSSRLFMARLVGGIDTQVRYGGERMAIPEIEDGEKAAEMLREIAEQTQSPYIKREILMIFATGMDKVPQDKETARRILDSL